MRGRRTLAVLGLIVVTLARPAVAGEPTDHLKGEIDALYESVKKSGEDFRKLARPGRRAPAKKADGSGVSKEGSAAA